MAYLPVNLSRHFIRSGDMMLSAWMWIAIALLLSSVIVQKYAGRDRGLLILGFITGVACVIAVQNPWTP